MIKDTDLICEPCAKLAGLVKVSIATHWYVGKELTNYSGEYIGHIIDKTCIVCDSKQSKKTPLIEIECLKVGE